MFSPDSTGSGDAAPGILGSDWADKRRMAECKEKMSKRGRVVAYVDSN